MLKLKILGTSTSDQGQSYRLSLPAPYASTKLPKVTLALRHCASNAPVPRVPFAIASALSLPSKRASIEEADHQTAHDWLENAVSRGHLCVFSDYGWPPGACGGASRDKGMKRDVMIEDEMSTKRDILRLEGLPNWELSIGAIGATRLQGSKKQRSIGSFWPYRPTARAEGAARAARFQSS